MPCMRINASPLDSVRSGLSQNCLVYRAFSEEISMKLPMWRTFEPRKDVSYRGLYISQKSEVH